MTAVPPSQPPFDPAASRRGPGEAAGAGMHKPRVKMLETSGELVPAGATYTPPTTAPLPERGAGVHLFLTALAASVAMLFFVLLAYKL